MFCINTAEVSRLSPSMSWPSLTVCSIHIFNAAGSLSKDDQKPFFLRPIFATKSCSFTFHDEFDIYFKVLWRRQQREYEREGKWNVLQQCITWLLAVSTLYAHYWRLSLLCCRCPSGLVHYIYDITLPHQSPNQIPFIPDLAAITPFASITNTLRMMSHSHNMIFKQCKRHNGPKAFRTLIQKSAGQTICKLTLQCIDCSFCCLIVPLWYISIYAT